MTGPSEPVRELADLADAPPEGFEGRVRRSILRRTFASDLVGYAWFTPFRVLLEYFGLILTLIGGPTTTREGD